MNADTLANMPPDEVTLASLAQGVGTVIGRLDGIDSWRRDERDRAIQTAHRNDEAHEQTARAFANAADRFVDLENGQAKQAATLSRIEAVLTGDAPGSLPEVTRRVATVEKEIGDDQRMRARWRGFWRDPVTLAIVGAILTLIVTPLVVLAVAAVRDRAALRQSVAVCDARYKALASQAPDLSRDEIAYRAGQLERSGCPVTPGALTGP